MDGYEVELESVCVIVVGARWRAGVWEGGPFGHRRRHIWHRHRSVCVWNKHSCPRV